MPAHALRAIITRPGQDADAWAAQIQRNGIPAVALPMIDIVAVPDRSTLIQSWKDLAQYDALMFVSSNAVSHFFAARPADVVNLWGEQGPKAPRAWVTGPGSRAALLAQGVQAERVDMPASAAQSLDSEALWLQVESQIKAGTRILIVRGDKASEAADGLAAGSTPGQGRDWLAVQLQERGAQVHYVVAYARRPPQWTAAQREIVAQSLLGKDVWVWSSAEALGNLLMAFPGQSWAGAKAVATHARIAQAARLAGFGKVALARPGLAALCASIESLA
jgi:uroporphyrinogen-III synthase